MSQEIKDIPLRGLVLWTENPRDPIDPSADNQNVVDRAITDSHAKWNLAKLAKEMGGYYDLSELPTIVYHEKKPIVYDGNRRIVLGMLKHNYVSIHDFDVDIPDFPTVIPCNVCSIDIALQNVFRKHADSGSWLPLERDIFLNKHMKKEKSHFLLMDEATGMISANPHLNQRFVKDEIFRDDILEKLGFSFQNEVLLSRLTASEALSVLDDLSRKIKDKKISTRNNRGKVLEVLNPVNQRLVDENKRSQPAPIDLKTTGPTGELPKPDNRRSRRTKHSAKEFFGKPLFLKMGSVGNLYRDIVDLYKFYLDNKQHLSDSFPAVTRMALRLLCETAAKENKETLDFYVKTRFQIAKTKLNQDDKTTLSTQNVTESSITQLLQTGAHNYSASSNMEQTLAMSLIIGEILTASHGKEETT